ncbi:hypothetical protein ABZ568_07740 [Streptomyces olindensis]|uniref:Integral membrane protein n=1 Tax=Streptomyces olindensis TaxID=358823 RepID=A0ABV2XR78_9ACTN
MTLLPVFVGLVVGWVALRGLLAYLWLPGWAKACAVLAMPLAAVAWVAVMIADDPFLFPETAPCPREPMAEGVLGDGRVSGVSEPFPPRAYCVWEDGTTYDLAPGAAFVFWVSFAAVVVPLGLGLWHAVRNPKSLLR